MLLIMFGNKKIQMCT